MADMFDPEPCHYCGLPADCIDHVVPLVVVRALMELPDGTARLRARVLTVPACRQCNGIAGGSYFDTLAERAAYVKQRLRKKLASDLDCKDFTVDELDEFEPGLRGYVMNAMRRKIVAEQRLSWEPGQRSRASRRLSDVLADARRRFAA
jgi:hypothetical protein